MSTFADLSRYTYTAAEPGVDMRNIGWLGEASTFPTGKADPRVRDTLLRFAAERRNWMRGWHNCELCTVESPIEVPSRWDARGLQYLGNGELHVPTASKVTYVAPTLLIHYMDAHEYLPPREFLDAVLALAPSA